MPFFCISDHTQLPLVRAGIEKRRPQATAKDGFRLRYCAEVSESALPGAEQVLEMLDDAMGSATKAPGVFQANYETVRHQYQLLLDAAPKAGGRPTWLRYLALALALALALTMAAIIPWVIFMYLFFAAFQSKSGLLAAAEASFIWSIFDWRPTIRKLVNYWRV